MTTRTKLSALVAVLLTTAFAALPAPSAAHDPNPTYGSTAFRWAPTTLEFYFDQTVPKGRWRDRIAAGALEWNRYGRSVSFSPYYPQTNSTRSDPSFTCPTQLKTRSIVFRASFGSAYGRAIGLNFLCRSNAGRPLYFRQYYNADFPDFWTDPNRNERVPEDKIDLQSVAAHEMGHAAGHSTHYDDDGPDADDGKDFKPYCRSWTNQTVPEDVPYSRAPGEAPNTAKQTMCSTASYGNTSQRRLGIHDRGTFRNAYP